MCDYNFRLYLRFCTFPHCQVFGTYRFQNLLMVYTPWFAIDLFLFLCSSSYAVLLYEVLYCSFFNPDFRRKQDMYHHCFALNLGASSVNGRQHWCYVMLIQLIPMSLEKAGREGAMAGGACNARCTQEQLKIPARGWWESFLPCTEQIIVYNSWQPSVERNCPGIVSRVPQSLGGCLEAKRWGISTLLWCRRN